VSETCSACGQSVREGQSQDYFHILSICDEIGKWGTTGLNAGWQYWKVGEEHYRDGKVYELVQKTPEDLDELEGYGAVAVSMVFEIDYDNFVKVTGTWNSYDGIQWNEQLVKVEKKERTSVYYG